MKGRWWARAGWAYHRFLDRLTGGRVKTDRFIAPTLWLTTVGRKTGRVRQNALIYVADGLDLVVVATNDGADNDPAWWLNLQTYPETIARINRDRRAVRAREATPVERDRLWPKLDATFPKFAMYRSRTTRHIAMVILEPRSG